VAPGVVVSPAKFELPEEGALHAAYAKAAAAITPGMALPAFLAACAPLASPIDAYFEKVFVMAEDEGVRANRLALLRDLAALPRGVLDFAQLPGF